MKILVADDDATSLLLLRMELQSLGHDCESATDGAAAWAAFRAGHHDVVISDWMMPGQSGPQLCESIRADPHGADVYLLLLTGHEGEARALEGIGAGADGYLVKPLDPAELELRLVAAAARMEARLPAQRAEPAISLDQELAVTARSALLGGLGDLIGFD
jgi:DNA-binding response OmpR family regulator